MFCVFIFFFFSVEVSENISQLNLFTLPFVVLGLVLMEFFVLFPQFLQFLFRYFLSHLSLNESFFNFC